MGVGSTAGGVFGGLSGLSCVREASFQNGSALCGRGIRFGLACPIGGKERGRGVRFRMMVGLDPVCLSGFHRSKRVGVFTLPARDLSL